MLQSMTAFARRQTETPALELVWELRSVNHRYLEVQFRLPEPLRVLETALRDLARRHLKRGKVDCTLRAEGTRQVDVVEINRPLLLKLLAVLEQIRRDAPEIHSPTSMELLRWPGLLSDDAAIDAAEAAPAVVSLFETTLEALIAERQREGRELAAAITTKLDDIAGGVAEVRGLAGALSAEIRQRLMGRLQELTTTLDPARLEQEVALLAQKADVAEELDRLSIHLDEARAHQSGPGPHGRRLDFLCQEMMREANTLAAKSLLPEMSTRAVDLKVVIEQIREQVQNVE